MWLVILITFAIYMCLQLTISGWDDLEDILPTNLVTIIKSEVVTFSIVGICSMAVCLKEPYNHILSVNTYRYREAACASITTV